MDSKSLILAKSFLGQIVNLNIDRPLGSFHPKWNFKYPINYGYLKNIFAPDGEELDAYVLRVNKPIKEFTGKVVAIIHRFEDDDDKLVVIPQDQEILNDEIEREINFQEKWFKHEILRV